jgi:hypothetical protein
MLRDKTANPVISYKNLRRLIGILGMLLPVVCFLGGYLFGHQSLQRSISYYYHTNVRDAFVGLLIGVGLFLTTYNGYEKIDSILSKITGFAGVGIAVFPCLLERGAATSAGFFQLAPAVSGIIHLSCAALFFVLLAVNSIFIFTLSHDKNNRTRNKIKRNAIYIACGIAILSCMACLVIAQIVMDPDIVRQRCLVFIFETLMLEAFGISWLVKGETILRD